MEISITDEAMEQLELKYGGKTLRILPKVKTWGGSSFELVLDEPDDNDNIYDFNTVKLIMNKAEEKDAPFIDIDYKDYPWGSEFVVTTFC